MAAGPPRQLELRLAHRTQLGSVAKCLLEVVSDDLGVLGDSAARGLADPRGEPLVKLRADPLRGRPVGGLLDQDVAEPEPLAGPADETGPIRSLRTRASMCRATNGRAPRAAARPCLGGELLADHGGTGDHGTLTRPEAIEARRQQRRDRRGYRELGLVATPLGEHGDELFDEERVSIGDLEHPRPCGRGETPSEVGDQRLAVASGRRSSMRSSRSAFRGTSRVAARGAPDGRCKQRGSAHFAPARPGTRRGRERWARPNARPRRRRAAAAPAPVASKRLGSPRRSPRVRERLLRRRSRH